MAFGFTGTAATWLNKMGRFNIVVMLFSFPRADTMSDNVSFQAFGCENAHSSDNRNGPRRPSPGQEHPCMETFADQEM